MDTMPEACGRRFDEALLSGFVDGALTQADEQRVRVHVEDCAACRMEVEGMLRLREVTMSSQFRTPADDQWSEVPRGRVSALSFGVGWLVIVVYLAGITAFGLWQFWTSDEPILGKLVAVAVPTGIALLFLSVLIDRLKAMRTDRYRRVQK
jgi:predicted anti-sigma-YlaC factor YlaD